MPVETILAGSVGTVKALELARTAGARAVVASSSEVYGDALTHPQREDYRGATDPVGPLSAYGATLTGGSGHRGHRRRNRHCPRRHGIRAGAAGIPAALYRSVAGTRL